MDLAALIDALRRPDAWPEPPVAPIEVRHTHISVLFFTDRRVYKVKKPVNPGFLDYSTLERRRRFCREEVRLNRRLAPDVYLGVAPIVRTPAGDIRLGGDGEPIEYAVEMKRLPDDRMLDAILERGEITNDQLDQLVDILVRFHADAAHGPDVGRHGRAAEIAAQVHDNLDGLAAFIGRTITARQHSHLTSILDDWLDRNGGRLDQRADEGRVREGHGDLHAGNICLLDDDIVIYDCIEFSERFRCRDVACELAFLAMDLDRRGRRGFGGYLLHRYAAQASDPELPEIAWFFKIHLALVRAKVASMRAQDADVAPAAQTDATMEARSYVHLATAATLPPALILMCGLPGAGKSVAARDIAAPFGAAVVRTDVVRKELARRESPADLYTPSFSDRTYDATLERALEHLRDERTAIVDATFTRAARRAPFVDAARRIGAPLLVVEMTCPPEVVRTRLDARTGDPDEASDADWAVYEEARATYEPPTEIDPGQRLEVASPADAEALQSAVLDRLIDLARVRPPQADG